MAPSGRFVAVGAILATFCAVALLGLAADQYSAINEDALLQKGDNKAAEVLQLEKIMAKQQKMEAKEAKLLNGIKAEEHLAAAKKKVVHAQAAVKAAAKPVQKAAMPAELKPARLQSLDQTSKIAQLKAELAAAEKKQHNEDKSAAAPKPAHDDPAAAAQVLGTKIDAEQKAKKEVKDKSLVTGKDFLKLDDKTGVSEDAKIAKGADLKGLGWMGSKDDVDGRLRALNCDPSSFVCSGTAAQKAEALKIVKQIQASISHDADAVKAYGWKEEHALPPAPHM